MQFETNIFSILKINGSNLETLKRLIAQKSWPQLWKDHALLTFLRFSCVFFFKWIGRKDKFCEYQSNTSCIVQYNIRWKIFYCIDFSLTLFNIVTIKYWFSYLLSNLFCLFEHRKVQAGEPCWAILFFAYRTNYKVALR